MKTNFILLYMMLVGAFSQFANAQGCVAIRGMSSCGFNLGEGQNLKKGEFFSQVGFRYFKSFRHFRGHKEETHRVEDGTQVINHSYFLDLSVNYGVSERLYLSFVLPFVWHNRSSMYEHGGNPPNGLGERHETSSMGISDMRIGGGYWLFDSKKSHFFNLALGLNVKLPTGKFDYTDSFYNQGENKDEDLEKVVDQSIQPGDGGLGFALDLQGYYALSPAFLLTTNINYLFNVQETNGVLTRNGRSEFSCPDQFALRLGAYYNSKIHGLSAYIGGRLEGVPSKDIIGGSAGYRRPGYVVSAEPGLAFNTQNVGFNFRLPIALIRNRTQSYEDKQRTLETGVYRHGDAAFADYLINFSMTYRFGRYTEKMTKSPIPKWEGATN